MNSSTLTAKLGVRETWLASDAALIAVLAVVTLVSRVPFRSQLLYHWDSVNFALGMERFDVRLHQPHPPGYLLYILLGRVTNLTFGDPNTSLVWISVLFSSLTVAAVYLLGRRSFGRVEGLVAALITLTGPAFWFYSEVALTYILEASFVTVLALTCLETLRGNKRMVVISAIVLGISGGFRQTTLVLMLPMFLYSLWFVSWRQKALGLSLLSGTVIAWLTPTIVLSGGLNAYLDASRSIGGGVMSNFELLAGGQAALAPFIRLGTYLFYGLTLGLLPLIWFFARGVRDIRQQARRLRRDERVAIFGFWLIPNLVLYAPLVRAPGHTFSFITALAVLAAAGLVAMSRILAGWLPMSAGRLAALMVTALVFVNIGFFIAAPTYLFNVRRIVTTTPSWSTIRGHDRDLEERVAQILQQFTPSTTVLLVSGPEYRHPDYYLRGFHTINLETANDVVQLTQDDLPPGTRWIIVYDDSLVIASADRQIISLPSGGQISYIPIASGQELIVTKSSRSL